MKVRAQLRRGALPGAVQGLFLLAVLVMQSCEPAYRSPVPPPAGPLPTGFSEMDVTIIRDYYGRWGSRLQSDHRHSQWLRRQIQRGALMPQGLLAELLPPDLERLLLPLPAEFVRLKVGPDIILLDRQMNLIVDVIKDVDR